MSRDNVRVVNSETGGAATVPRWLAEHPVFGASLVEVKAGTKPHVPELYVPQTVEDYVDAHPSKIPTFDEPDEEIDEE